jgi:regulator of sigma E protease
MDVILKSVLPFIGILVALIVIHEMGHFFTAKWFGIKVLEAGLGYPPKLWSFRRGETEYSFNALPLGGFVRMLGEEDPSDPQSLAAAPRWKRVIVIASGAFMNFILAILLFAMALMIPQERDVSHARVGGVIPESPAATAIVQRDDGTELEERGLKEGDIIFSVNGRDVQSVGELGYHIRLNLGNTVDMRIRRTGAAGVGGVASEEFLTARVHARWSADAHTFETTTADDSGISATDETPIDVQITPAEGFDAAGVLVIGAGTPSEEKFEYCARSARFLRLTERAVDGTAASDHPGGSTVTRSVSQGPTGIQIGPAYSATVPLTEDEKRQIAEDPPACGPVPTVKSVPFSEVQSTPPWEAFPEGARRSVESVILAGKEIISRLAGGVAGGGEGGLRGPVGIADLTGDVVEQAGWVSLMEFAALISMNLAILNILPLPMLDGGRLMFVLLEYVRGGRRIAPEREAMVHFVGLVAILIFAVVVTYFDVLRIL